MNRYGRMAWRHWSRWLPISMAKIEDPETFFSALGQRVETRIEERAAELAGADSPGEGYLAKLGRLSEARMSAEAQVLREMVLLEPETDPDRPANIQADQAPLTNGQAGPGEPNKPSSSNSPVERPQHG